MSRTLLTALVCSMSITQALAQKDPKALAILDAMSKKYQSIPAFTADFSYIMENETEGIDEQFDGTITVKNGKYKLKTAGQEITNDGVSVWTFLKDDNEVTISEYDEEEDEISLSNIFELHKAGYKYLLLETKNNGTVDVVDLVPEDRDKTFFKIRMEIRKSDSQLQNFRIFDKSGSRFLYRVNTFTANTTIQDSDFTFNEKDYPNVEVLDFR